MQLGLNLSFAVKRWPEPERWAAEAAALGVEVVQFSYDLLDPWWPEPTAAAQAERVRAAAAAAGIAIHSAQVGLAAYTYNGLLHTDPDQRVLGERWWQRAIDLAAAMGATAMGGPVGAMTVGSAGKREERFGELVETLGRLADRASLAGLDALLVEPTPLRREIPGSLEEAERLAAALGESSPAVPVRYVLDVGHALYEPLYGEGVRLEPWLERLGDHIGVLHLQNFDRRSDAHWGWPDPRGDYDVAGFAAAVRAAGLDGLPVFLEVFYPFELDDDAARANLASSVEHCRRALAEAPGRATQRA